MTGLQSVEDRLDAVNVRIAVLAGNGVQARLEPLGVGLLCVILDLTSADVALEVAHPEIDLLSGETILVCLELEELLAVDDRSTSTASATCSSTRRKRDASALSVGSNNAIQPRLRLRL